MAIQCNSCAAPAAIGGLCLGHVEEALLVVRDFERAECTNRELVGLAVHLDNLQDRLGEDHLLLSMGAWSWLADDNHPHPEEGVILQRSNGRWDAAFPEWAKRGEDWSIEGSFTKEDLLRSIERMENPPPVPRRGRKR